MVGVGHNHACATRSDQTLWCWGKNASGQLGVGNTSNQSTPTQVAGSSWSAVYGATAGDQTVGLE
jgi:alpha-tubulin suppressor-like RCC1 family protein